MGQWPHPLTKEMSSKGGKSVSPAKRLATMITGAKYAKCKNCKARCDFKITNIEQDKNMFCIVPEARGEALFYGRPVWNIEVIKNLSIDTLDKMRSACEDIKDLKMLHDAVMAEQKLRMPTKIEAVIHNINWDQIISDCIVSEDAKEVDDDESIIPPPA